MSKNTAKPRRDFLFIDESGDPGPTGSDYYVCTLIHVTDSDIKHLYDAFCNFRFAFDHYGEVHSYKIKPVYLQKLNRYLSKKRRYFHCSTVYLNKAKYKGFYLKDRGKYKQDSVLFRKYMYRQVIDWHFQNYSIKSSKLELILDRSNLSSDHFSNLKSYLSRYSSIPQLDDLTEVDSKYVDLIQLADCIGAQFKCLARGEPKLTSHSYSFIKHKDITFENGHGEKY